MGIFLRLKKLILNLFFLFLCGIILLPMLWLIINSFKSNVELFNDSLALPEVWQFSNYVKAWNLGLFDYFKNSVLVSFISIAAILILSALLTYGLTRFRVKGANFVLFIILGGMALSEQVALVPLYKMLQSLGLYIMVS
ncbi:MAG TPA: hypothetical protein IAA11_06185 [Candidatus Blautia intestinigallinarum]|nr:hypothetical protein [Candidatus Blautia intestinigallinarum]